MLSVLRRAALALALLSPLLVHSDGVRISPVVLELASARDRAVLTVHNDSTQPRTLQAQALLWRQGPEGDLYEETEDLFVIPAIAELPPGGTQLFRVGLRQPSAAPAERSYRVVLEDISTDPSTGRMVAFRYAHNLPLLIAPEAPVVRLVRWKNCAGAAGSACIELMNAGNQRVKITGLRVQAGGRSGELKLPQGPNILAGATQKFMVPLPGPSTQVDSVQVEPAHGVELPTVAGGF